MRIPANLQVFLWLEGRSAQIPANLQAFLAKSPRWVLIAKNSCIFAFISLQALHEGENSCTFASFCPIVSTRLRLATYRANLTCLPALPAQPAQPDQHPQHPQHPPTYLLYLLTLPTLPLGCRPNRHHRAGSALLDGRPDQRQGAAVNAAAHIGHPGYLHRDDLDTVPRQQVHRVCAAACRARGPAH